MQDVEINGEIWKDVVGYEGLYEVSSHGRVKSVARVYQSPEDGFNWTKETTSSLKSLRLKKDGYVDTGLMKDGRVVQKNVHQLVAQAFIPNPENKRCVNHIDNNRSNNHVSNLEWSTHKENTQHSFNQGRGAWQRQWGESNVSAKISLSDVLFIRVYCETLKIKDLSTKLGINRDHVSRIIRKDRWNFPEAFPEFYMD